MKCPRDGTTLARVVVRDIELDKCHHCDGLWFDRGELEKIRDAKLAGVEEDIEEQYGSPKVEPGKAEGYMRCPRCAGRLQQISYTYLRPVRIDRCEKCLGFWLDDGELNAVAGEKKTLDEAVASGRLASVLRAAMKWWDQK